MSESEMLIGILLIAGGVAFMMLCLVLELVFGIELRGIDGLGGFATKFDETAKKTKESK